MKNEAIKQTDLISMSETQPKTDNIAREWWLLIAQMDKVPANHTDWLCARLAEITRFAQTQAEEKPVCERIWELVVEIHEAHQFNSWQNDKLSDSRPEQLKA